jgi:hypothetical protein
MAKKETVKITPEGLNLVTILNYSSIAEMNGFYGKEVYFTDGFYGDTQFLFQSLGNLGAFARNKDLDIDISIIIISNKIIENPNTELYYEFITDLESKLNQNNSPYRRIKLLSENQLMWYIENRITNTKDELLENLIKKYKSSKTKSLQSNLFE